MAKGSFRNERSDVTQNLFRHLITLDLPDLEMKGELPLKKRKPPLKGGEKAVVLVTASNGRVVRNL